MWLDWDGTEACGLCIGFSFLKNSAFNARFLVVMVKYSTEIILQKSGGIGK